jgi:AbrB family looped-hinge helix DNA binding protein
MKVTEKGQITIPQEIREKYGFLPESEVQFVEEQGVVYLTKAPEKSERGKKLTEHMRNKATIKMTTEQIMQLIRGNQHE